MKHISAISVAAVVLFFWALAPSAERDTTRDANTKKELEKLEREWIEEQDQEKLGRIVADDFVYIDADANVNSTSKPLHRCGSSRMS